MRRLRHLNLLEHQVSHESMIRLGILVLKDDVDFESFRERVVELRLLFSPEDSDDLLLLEAHL